MVTDTTIKTEVDRGVTAWLLPVCLSVGTIFPLLGTLTLVRFFKEWHWVSLPLHSTLEMGGAVLGMLLALILLFPQQKTLSSRNLWLACALIVMAVLDAFHSSVEPGEVFTWLNALAVLGCGLFFVLLWLPEAEISDKSTPAVAGVVMLLTIAIGVSLVTSQQKLPVMLVGDQHTHLANTINLIGGGLILTAALNFVRRYRKSRSHEDLLLMTLCLLLSGPGILFPMTGIWDAGWWFWHLVRFGGYLFAFGLVWLFWRRSHHQLDQAYDELNILFNVSVDGKRLVDQNFNQLRTNDTFLALAGVTREAAEGMRCHEAFCGSLCDTDQCPVRQFAAGFTGTIEREVTKTRRDGTHRICLLKAVRLNNPDGSFRGAFESFLDITELKEAEAVKIRQSRLLAAVNQVFREALNAESEEEVGKTALRLAEELTASKFGFIGVINDAGLMDTIAISNPGWQACDIVVSSAKNNIKNMPLRGIDRTTLKEGRSRIVNADQIASHPDRVGTPGGHPPITCFLGVPFQWEQKTMGMIGLANKEGGYSPEDQQAIETLSLALYEVLLRKRAERQVQEQTRLDQVQNKLSDLMRGDLPLEVLTREIITFLGQQTKAQAGLIYLAGEDRTLRQAAGYAHACNKDLVNEYRPGEGLVGQAALEQKEIVLADVPEGYFTIESGLGETPPRHIWIKPIVHNDTVKAVVELGTLHEFDPSLALLLDAVSESIGVAIDTAQAREKLAAALEGSQQLTEELQVQQEELRVANEELEEQTQRLSQSEEQLKIQQEELEVTNVELEENNDLLARQKREVEQARQEIEAKAGELAQASRYKSEFLANMSHELRTPLNSLLLLAQGLERNRDGNLTGDQVEAARIIHGSGSDLLSLINEILDLSKIEAGRITLQLGPVRISELEEGVHDSFQHLAEEKGIDLELVVGDNGPAEILSDRKRVDQIIRNLVSNAVKFTERGGVTVNFGRPAAGTDLTRSGLTGAETLAISVRDSGIGIAPAQHEVIFEAFRQADGSTSRKYGGTGLGLSISRELAHLLGGEIQVASELGKGSTFTLYLPITLSDRREEPELSATTRGASVVAGDAERPRVHQQVPDDREQLAPSDRVMLVIEDDSGFATVLCGKCHEKGFKCLAAATGEEGLELATRHLPCAVILDLRLPGIDGWGVLSALKGNTRTRHIPVHIISAEESSTEALRKGAIGHLTKPITQQQLDQAFYRLEQMAIHRPKRMLVVDDDDVMRRETVRLIGNGDVKAEEARNGEEALAALRVGGYDCVVMDLGLPDMDGGELLARLEQEGVELPPVVVYTARDLSLEEEAALRERAESIVIKDVRSQERLLDEVSLFLHRVVSQMPEKKRKVIQDLHDTDALLQGKQVLVVDDDMRTTFALARLLADSGMKPVKAANGEKALQLLDQHPDIDLVLMDIMMPTMDGYETMRRIRSQERFRTLPIIALTAKAMPEDRQQCLAAGANDYLSKPLDQGRLFSMMRVWLCR